MIAALLQRAAGSRAVALRFQRAAARALLCYPWPHNVRELEQVLTRAELVALLGKHAGNVSVVGREMSTSRTQVQRLLERDAVDPAAFRHG